MQRRGLKKDTHNLQLNSPQEQHRNNQLTLLFCLLQQPSNEFKGVTNRSLKTQAHSQPIQCRSNNIA